MLSGYLGRKSIALKFQDRVSRCTVAVANDIFGPVRVYGIIARCSTIARSLYLPNLPC